MTDIRTAIIKTVWAFQEAGSHPPDSLVLPENTYRQLLNEVNPTIVDVLNGHVKYCGITVTYTKE